MTMSKARRATLELLTEVLPPEGANYAWCEAQVACEGSIATSGHEVRMRSQGGSDEDPENIRLVCMLCHDWIHSNPAEARVKGLLVRGHETAPSRQAPMRPPTRAELEAKGYWLDDEGQQAPAQPSVIVVFDSEGQWIGSGLGEAEALKSAYAYLRRHGW